MGFPPNATYRQLLEVLPLLDGKPASKSELVGLRALAFSQSVGLLTENDEWVDTTRSAVDTSMLTVSTDAETREFESVVSSAFSRGSVSQTKRRIARRGKSHRAVIDEGPTKRFELLSTTSVESANQAGLKDDGSFSRNVYFSLTDVIATLPKLAPIAHEDTSTSEVPQEEQNDDELTAIEDANEGSDEVVCVNGGATAEMTDQTTLPEDASTQPQGLSFISLSPVKAAKESAQGSVTDAKSEESLDVESQTNPQSPSHRAEEEESLASQSSAVGGDEDENGVPLAQEAPEQSRNGEIIASESSNGPSEHNSAGLPERTDQFDPFSQTQDVVFPDHVWDDDTSALSSLRTSAADSSSANTYQITEQESTYDGPDNLKGLPVLTNLELYFRYFVFRVSVPDAFRSYHDELSNDEKLKLILSVAPRIQLRPIDWRALETTVRSLSQTDILATYERFDRVWRVDALACGKLAAKRLTPYRKPKRGFHGDVLFSNGKLEKSCESRRVIMCTSDAAIYLISDYDAVTRNQISKSSSRRFPFPIPEDALFENGHWPHSLARHSIASLERITIGFGFQRLTLHFSPFDGSNGKASDEFAYILLTCSKLETISALQHFQSLTKEFGGSANLTSEALKIDNDDKQVLDALAVAVAPNAVGVVLHYQIVQQRWQHGDRGTVRRACFVTDTHVYLLDEDYVGDGSESFEAGARHLSDVCFKMVDSAGIEQVSEVQAGLEDPNSITLVIRPLSRLQRCHNWRFLCHDREGAEKLVDEVRKAIAMAC